MKLTINTFLMAGVLVAQGLPTVPSFLPPDISMDSRLESQEKTNVSTQSKSLNIETIEKEPIKNLADYKLKLSWIESQLLNNESEIKSLKTQVEFSLRPLEKKGEFEKQSDFEVRQSAWFEERDVAWNKATTPLNIKGRKLLTLKQKLLDNASSLVGEIEINSEPSGAMVVVDGKFLGKTPLISKGIEPGQHNIEIQLDGYESKSNLIEVIAEKTTEKEYILSAMSPFISARVLNLDSLKEFPVADESEFDLRLKFIEMGYANVESEYLEQRNTKLSNVIALSQKGEFERTEDYEARAEAWHYKNGELTKTIDVAFNDYRNRVENTYLRLKELKAEYQFQISSLDISSSAITLGTYDADNEKYPVSIDISAPKHKAVFDGIILADIPTAKKIKESINQVKSNVLFLNYTQNINGQDYHIAYTDLRTGLYGQNLELAGKFTLAPEIANDPNVIKARAKLKNGYVKSQKSVAWYKSPYTRFGLLALGSALMGYAAYINNDIDKDVKAYSPATKDQAVLLEKSIRDKESKRNIIGGVGALILVFDVAIWTF